MHKIGFIYQDPDHRNRHSDGVELVKIPGATDGSIGFFCAESEMLWTSPDEIGTSAGIPVKQPMAVQAADIQHICAQGYGHLIDLVRDFDTHTKVSQRIFLKNASSPSAFFTCGGTAFPALSFLLCHIADFHDDAIYFFSPDGASFWRTAGDCGIPERAQPNRRYRIEPASLSSIVSHQLVEHLTGIVQCPFPDKQAEPLVAIVFPR